MRPTPAMPARSRTPTLSCAGALAALFLLIPLHALVSGLVVRYLYHRLMVPMFPGLPDHLSIAAALGLALFVGYMTVDEASAAHDDRSLMEKECYWAAYRGVAVLLAWAIGAFI